MYIHKYPCPGASEMLRLPASQHLTLTNSLDNPSSSAFGVSTYNDNDVIPKTIKFVISPAEEGNINAARDPYCSYTNA